MKKLLSFLFATLNFLCSAYFLEAQQPRLMVPVGGHTMAVNSASFSPDGKLVVTASDDNTAQVWNAANGQLKFLATLNGHSDRVNNASFSPDGKSIVTASNDSTATVWKAADGELVVHLNGHTDMVNSASFSPDGKLIITTSSDRTARVWNAANGQLVADLLGHTQSVNSAVFSSNGKWVVTASSDNTAKVWKIANWKQIAECKGHTRLINSAAFSPDSKKIVTASGDSTARVWKSENGKLIVALTGHTGLVKSAAFSPDGQLIVTASMDHTAKVWNASNGKLVATLRGHTEGVKSAAFSSDGKLIVTAADNTAKVWNAVTGELITDLKGHTGSVNSAVFSPDGKFITTASSDHSTKVWNTVTGQLSADVRLRTNLVSGAAFSPDGKSIVTTSYSGTAQLWKDSTGQLIAELKGHRGYVNGAAFSPNGKLIVTSSVDSTAKVWNAATGKLVVTLKGHTNKVYSALFSPDGKSIVTASEDRTARVWNATTGKLAANLTGHSFSVKSAVFSPDGKSVVTASEDHTAKVWNAVNGKLVSTLTGHTGAVNSAVFSPDGKSVVTAAVDSTARLWTVAKGKLVNILKGHTGDVKSAVFSPNGKLVVTASDDYTAKIWTVATGKMAADLKGHTGEVWNIAFSTDGNSIVTTSSDNTSKIWDALNGSLLKTIRFEGNEEFAGIDFSHNRITTSSRTSEISMYDMNSGNKLYTSLALDSTEYLVYDKGGHYDGTQAARKLLYFVCGNEVIDLDQVKDQLWVPNLAARILKGETINARTLNDLSICGLIPTVDQVENKTAYLFKITPQKGGLGEIVLYVNGIETKKYNPPDLKQVGAGYELSVEKKDLKPYLISQKDNAVSLKAYTKQNDFSSRGITILVNAPARDTVPPNLYGVIIGVSDYKGEELDLKYAAKDAGDFSRAVSLSSKKLLGDAHVFMYNLTTAKEHYHLPEKKSIKDVFTEIGQRATPNDILLIFFAGHGVLQGDKKQFYFLTTEASAVSTNTPTGIQDVGISLAELKDWINPVSIKAQKRILIMDACHSGSIVGVFDGVGARNDDRAEEIKQIDKLNEQSGVYILSASAVDQNAYEIGRYKQGLLTYALLKVIKDHPEVLEHNRYLNVSGWFNAAQKIVSDIVSENSTFRQDPQLASTTNFNIGIVDEDLKTNIVLADEKPLFRESIFQNSRLPNDDLDFSKLLNRQLESISSADDGRIFFLRGNSAADAYALRGGYTVNGGDITIIVNLKQGSLIKATFAIKGKKNNLEQLAADTIKKAADWVMKNK